MGERLASGGGLRAPRRVGAAAWGRGLTLLALSLLALGCRRDAVPGAGGGGGDGGDGGVVRAKAKERCNGIDDDGDGKIDEGCPIRISFASDGDDKSVTIGGGRIFWTHAAPVDGNALREEIRMTPIPNGPDVEPYQVVDYADPSDPPSVAGDRVTFAHAYQDGIGVRDLVTGQTWSPGAGLIAGSPRLTADGHHVVYVKNLGTGIDGHTFVGVEAWDLDTGATHELSSTVYGAVVVTAGTQVVWLDERTQDVTNLPAERPDLWIGDVTTLATRLLVHLVPPGALGAPAAFDGRRVYLPELHDLNFLQYSADGTCQLASYDVASGARRPIGNPSHLAGDACAGYTTVGTLALLDDQRGVRELGPLSDLCLVRFDTGEQKAITNYPRKSTAPRISDGRLVWLDDRNDVFNVYMMDLRDVDEGDLSPEGVTP
jgi:beta propeller repeat protein